MVGIILLMEVTVDLDMDERYYIRIYLVNKGFYFVIIVLLILDRK
jgi:hypothetical protein